MNVDEELYRNKIGNFHKMLPHNGIGEVDPAAYDALLDAVQSGDLAPRSQPQFLNQLLTVDSKVSMYGRKAMVKILKSMKSVLRCFLTVLAAGAATALVAPPGTAQAAAIAYNQKNQFLTAYPADSMATSCKSRRIWLASGTYDWGQLMATHSYLVRPDMYLGAGWYTWKDCLDPKDSYYSHTTWLDPDNPNWVTASINGLWNLTYSGNYNWGFHPRPAVLG
jgi:hypothetical protein